MNKENLRELVLEQLTREWLAQNTAAALARDEAINEESRPESKYDTHSQEAAYLAEGQARLAADIDRARAAFQALPLPALCPQDPAALGALVSLEQSGQIVWYLLGPSRGGTSVQLNGTEVLVITPQSPLGRQLMGARAGQTVTTPRGLARIAAVQ
jgi:transcription elongation GreA/GreB family factor